MTALTAWILAQTGAAAVSGSRHLQTLWGGYGEIRRIRLASGPAPTVILKRVDVPVHAPDSRSHARKLRSYAVESAWYRDWSADCDADCRVPRCLGLDVGPGRWWFLLEDLDAAGFPERRCRLSAAERDLCLAWLAAFHATFLGRAPTGLWATGTYWHLATRPDELAAMGPGPLRDAAAGLDAALSGARHQTLVHGDAKPANFCFGPRGVAAVDFQYVGGGCGVRDVAYLLGGRGDPKGVSGDVARYLDHLGRALAERQPRVDRDAVIAEWLGLFPVACRDFERFLAGWG